MDGRSVRVLLIDDDEDDFIITRDLLEDIRGQSFALEWVSAYEDAQEMIDRHRHDVYLIDYHLGERTGLDLLNKAAANGCRAPMILLTGQGDHKVDMKAMKAGAADYLIKGQIDPPLLGRSIRYALDRARSLKALHESREDLRCRASELEALADVSAALRSAQTLDEMAPLVLQKTTPILGASASIIFLFEPESGHLVARACQPPIPNFRKTRRLGEGITGHVAASGEIHISDDLMRDPLADIGPGVEPFASTVVSCIALPLRAKEHTVGVMHIAFQDQHSFTPQEIRLLTAISDIAANALYRAQVLERVEQMVTERTAELAKANQRLEELDRLKSKFVSDVSHELRTPVANIKLYLHLLRRSSSERYTQYLTVLDEQSNRLASLIEDILNLSRLDVRDEEVEFEPVNLNALIEQVVAASQASAEADGLELTFEPDPALPRVNGEGKQLAQVVTNLLTNAINYTSEGWVKVSTRIEARQACLEVQDTGMGIAPEDMPHLFERFYRGRDVGSSAIPGSGLGLSIVKEIVNIHGGKVEVESLLGEGSTFRVWLPLELSSV